jgi:hypothetical protein
MELIVEIGLIVLGLLVVGVAFIVVTSIVITAKVMEAVENERRPVLENQGTTPGTLNSSRATYEKAENSAVKAGCHSSQVKRKAA